MENASKALIIAGAILVSLIIIALGVLIVNRMSSTVSKASLNSEEAQTHNSKFDSYFGDKVTATETRNLLKAIAANNVTADTSDELKRIYVGQPYNTQFAVSWSNESVNNKYKSIKDGYTYTIRVANDNSNDDTSGGAGYYRSGFLKSIVIIENTR